MTRTATDSWGAVIISFLLAYILVALPLPEWMAVRPCWVALVLVYWVIAAPHKVGVVTGWISGLFLDALTGSVLGQNALSLSLVAYIAYLLHMRIRVFPLWQQCLTMVILVGIYQLVNIMIIRAVYLTPWTLLYWLSVLLSALVWPLVTLSIGLIRGRGA